MKNISNLIELINSKNRNKFFVLLILTFVSLILEIFLLKFIFIIFNYFSNLEIGNESEFYTNINFFVSKFDLNYDFYII